MRVASKTLYDTMRLRLGNLTEALKRSNDVVSTGKRIINLSDDPIGVSQVLNLKSSLSNIDQLEKNIDLGKNWLSGGETALTNSSDQIQYAKQLVLQLANDSSSASQRKDAVETVNGILTQLLSLSNSSINGQSIFAGTKTNITPFSFDDNNDPSKVTYSGNETPFSIKSEKGADIQVGRNGSDVYFDDSLTVDSSNNKIDFIEKTSQKDGTHEVSNIGAGGGLDSSDVTVAVNNYDALTHGTPLPSGTKPLKFRWNGVDKWDVSNDPGYGLPESIDGTSTSLDIDLDHDGIDDISMSLSVPAGPGGYVEMDLSPKTRIVSGSIPEGKYSADSLATAVGNAMTAASSDSGFGVGYKAAYDASTKKFSIMDDGTYSGYLGFEIMADTAGNPPVSRIQNINTGGEVLFSDAHITVNNEAALGDGTPYPPGSAPMRLTYNGHGGWDVANDPGYGLPPTVSGTDKEIGLDLGGGAEEDLTVNLDSPATAGGFVEFDILPDFGKYSLGPDLGLDAAAAHSPSTSDNEFTPINNITIDYSNNRINFQEVDESLGESPQLTAVIPGGDYSDPNALASAMETAMEAESAAKGFTIDYDVQYDDKNSRFTFKANDSSLRELKFLWNSGINSDISAADTLGIDNEPDASGSFGGDLLANGWDNGDTISATFSTGRDSYTYTHLVNTGVDTSASIISDIQTQLTANLGKWGSFSVNGTDIDFTMNNKLLKISNITDDNGSGAGIDAAFSTSAGQGSVTRPTGAAGVTTGGGSVTFYAPGDDIVTFPRSDNLVRPITIDSNNNHIDFTENIGGGPSAMLTATIPQGDYTADELAQAVETSMEGVSANGINYQVGYSGSKFTIQEDPAAPILTNLDLAFSTGPDSATSAATTLGFDSSMDHTGAVTHVSDNNVVLVNIDNTNSSLDFKEYNSSGKSLGEISANIPEGDYTSMGSLAAAVESAMDDASKASGLGIDYDVSFDSTSNRFLVRENGTNLNQLDMLWNTGSNKATSAAGVLGFSSLEDDTMKFSGSDNDVTLITIDDTNMSIDFKEILSGQDPSAVMELTALIPKGDYTSPDSLASAIETAMEGESAASGNSVDYDVSYDPAAKKFSIKENGTVLANLDMLWGSGTNSSNNAAGVLGFDKSDDNTGPLESSGEKKWGIFNTLIDLKKYLGSDDTEGIMRSISRLQTNFEHMESVVSDTGTKYNRLETRNSILTDLNLNLTDRRANIEEADIVDATMTLKSQELAYQAALSSSASIMKLSLADYM